MSSIVSIFWSVLGILISIFAIMGMLGIILGLCCCIKDLIKGENIRIFGGW